MTSKIAQKSNTSSIQINNKPNNPTKENPSVTASTNTALLNLRKGIDPHANKGKSRKKIDPIQKSVTTKSISSTPPSKAPSNAQTPSIVESTSHSSMGSAPFNVGVAPKHSPSGITITMGSDTSTTQNTGPIDKQKLAVTTPIVDFAGRQRLQALFPAHDQRYQHNSIATSTINAVDNTDMGYARQDIAIQKLEKREAFEDFLRRHSIDERLENLAVEKKTQGVLFPHTQELIEIKNYSRRITSII